MLNKRHVVISILILMIAVCLFLAYRFVTHSIASARAGDVLEEMYSIVPGLGQDSGGSAGAGRDPMVSVSIDGIDIVGCLEIPSLGIMVPVTSGEDDIKGFVRYVSGSAAAGKLMLEGGKEDALKDIEKAMPGESVIFTDMDGVRYTYSVVTQYHLKEWGEGNNDLMVCCSTDEHTDFVLGCSAS